ncbi:hypothetical protein Hanom_Chr04g00332771 [Helianthus anomalus]
MGFLPPIISPQISFIMLSVRSRQQIYCSDDMIEIQYESCSSVDRMVVASVLIVTIISLIESSLLVVYCERSSSSCDNHQWMIIQLLFIHVLFHLSSVKGRLSF